MNGFVKRAAALLGSTLIVTGLVAAPSSAGFWLPSPNCGSTALTKADGTLWKCTFGDEFSNGSLDSRKWGVQTTAASGSHTGLDCLVNSSNNVSVSNGQLNLTVRKEPAPFTCKSPYGDFTTQYTAGMVSTWGTFAQTYGRFEIRAKFPPTALKGVQSALWLYPKKLIYGDWPSSGEIDIAEMYSSYPDRVVPYIHYTQADPSDLSVRNYGCMIADVAAFHTYVAEWTSTTITIKYDGVTCVTHVWNPAAPLLKPAPFDQPFMVLLTQGLGINNNAFDPLTTPLPATTQIDWVHIWR